MIGGPELTPLRAYAHQMPHYYIQSLGTAVSHPDSNEYSAFAQDTIRATTHFSVSLGVRYDLQTFSTKCLKANPLWQDSGKVPLDRNNFAPRVGFSYSFVHGQDLIRARDVNLPQPTTVQYPIFDSSGVNAVDYGTIASFSTWQLTQSLTCPLPPCINQLTRPIPQLGAIDVFESEASS